MSTKRRPIAAVVDLFAGAGGFGVGTDLARGDLRLSVEIDPIACETLRSNSTRLQTRVLEADVTELTGRRLRNAAQLSARDPLVVIGGAPCQPFSKAAYWTESGDDAAFRRARASGVGGLTKPPAPTEPRADGRRTLVEHFARLVIESKADGFVFENVPAITHPRNRPMLDGLVRELETHDYETAVVKAVATAYGVPQRRERVFVLGSRSLAPEPPSPTHRQSGGRPTRIDAHLEPMPTAGKACAPFRSKRFFEPEEVVQGRWAEHLRSVPPGWNYKAHTAWGGHPKPTFVTETRFWNFLLKLDPRLPSWTIAASPGPWTGPFHWTTRRLRIPELAALQGFPPGYKFAGTRRDAVRQIGNAVPPPLARGMVEAVLDTLAAGAGLRGRRVS
ncbi:MAG: DNA cytosine methyltransferase [Actinomycetota bacterium]